ncbi:MAG: ATP-binding cassette domain-containing protein [archaeon]|nr:ATP-binding cassette domain-containing protein [archaeon]
MLLKAQAISKAFGPIKVLKDVSLQINEGDRIGLVGANGAGKSTFLKILLGLEKADTGELTVRTDKIGYMSQFSDIPADQTVREVLEGSYSYVENIRRRQAEIDMEMASGGDIDWNALAEESAELESKIQQFEMEIGDKLEDVLKQVRFPMDIMDREMGSLSGGERTKVMIAKTAVQTSDCDLLIMDEPTSHLDISTVEWMERSILSSKCAVLVISHDRYFLDRIALKVVEIENGKSVEYKGNYSAYVDKKNQAYERALKEYERYASQKKKQETLANQMFHDCRRYMSSYKTRLMLIDKMEEKEKPDEAKGITVKIQAAHKSGKNVIMAENVSIERDGKTILSGIDLDIQKGDKIGVFGSNGAGKTTLLKAILGEIPVKGDLWVAPGAKIGYYSQNHESLDLNLTAEEQLLNVIGKDRKAEARNMLARFLLTGDDVTHKMETLSGGQRAKVAMCLLLHGETNVLVLDEPTNYVDIDSKHALEEALAEYDGVVITVTHDRFFLDNVCNKVAEVKDGKVTVYNDNYTGVKGAPEPVKAAEKGEMYRVTEPFTNWVNGKKYVKGDKVEITPSEMKGFEDALNKGKIRKV